MEQFTDDSSTRLGLDHGVSLRSTALERAAKKRAEEKVEYLTAIGVKDESELQRIVPRNVGAHDDLGARMQKYVDVGYSTLEALDEAERELIEEQQSGEAGDYLGASLQDLMRASITPDRRGSRSSGKRSGGNRPDPLQAEMTKHFRRVA